MCCSMASASQLEALAVLGQVMYSSWAFAEMDSPCSFQQQCSSELLL